MTQTIEKVSRPLGKVYRSGAQTIGDQLNELTDQFILDARRIDPSIKGGGAIYDMISKNAPARGLLAVIMFDRGDGILKQDGRDMREMPEHPNERVRWLAAEIRLALNDPAFLGASHIIIDRKHVQYVDHEQ